MNNYFLKSALAENNLALVGEKHGVKQNIDLIKYLFIKYNFECLALEWFEILSTVINKFPINTNNFNALESKAFNIIKEDGRGSGNHIKLLNNLHSKNRLKKVILFGDSTSYTDWNTRDKSYFDRFMLSYSSNLKTLVIAGSLHVKNKPFLHKNEIELLYPLGFYLKKEFGYIPTARIKYLSGKYRNMGIKNIPKGVYKTAIKKDAEYLVIDRATPL